MTYEFNRGFQVTAVQSIEVSYVCIGKGTIYNLSINYKGVSLSE